MGSGEFEMIQSKVYETEGKPCAVCNTTEKLTRHHLKDLAGNRTGEIQILCSGCHDNVENYYRKLGIVKTTPIVITHNEKLQLDYINGKIPFYSSSPKSIVNGILKGEKT